MFLDNKRNILNFRFTVDEYNKLGESHLYFVKVENGSVMFFPFMKERRFWVLGIRAINCSHPGPPDFYVSTLHENYNDYNSDDGTRIEAYGSVFINGGLYKQN